MKAAVVLLAGNRWMPCNGRGLFFTRRGQGYFVDLLEKTKPEEGELTIEFGRKRWIKSRGGFVGDESGSIQTLLPDTLLNLTDKRHYFVKVMGRHYA